jgi:hypothetical protein
MRQVLEALFEINLSTDSRWQAERADAVIPALRAALMGPEREPVAKYSDIVSDGGMDPRNKFDHPPPRREWQGLNFDQLQSVMSRHFGGCELTDDEADSAEEFARAIEAALKERNHG